MLIAEDLLLLLTDDDTGKLAASTTQTDVALGGALLVELTLMQHVDVAGPGERVKEGRLVVRNADPTGDPLLDEALVAVGRKAGKKPRSVVAGLGKGVRARLYERLVGRGVLREDAGRALGVFPRHRWPTENAEHEARVRVELATSLRGGVATDARTGALVSLLLALKAVDKTIGPDTLGMTKGELNQNAQRIAEGDWASTAVRTAIDTMNAAVTAAITAAVLAGASSGS